MVVNWDQRGAGKSYRAIHEVGRMNVEQFVQDTRELTTHLLTRRLLARFGGEVHGSRTGAMGSVLGGLLFSRENGLADRLNYFRGIFGSMKLLWPELMTVDLVRSAARFEIPVLFMLGRHDQECPAEVARRYFDVLQAPSKELVWFERSGHLPNAEERDAFNRALVDKVLPLARSAPLPRLSHRPC